MTLPLSAAANRLDNGRLPTGRRVLVVLVLLTFVRGLLYMAITPAWEGPDEPGHFEYVALLYRLGRVPLPRPDTESLPDLTRAINDSARDQRFEQFQKPTDVQWLDEQTPPVLASPREAGYQTPTYYEMLLPVYWLVRSQPVIVQYYALAFVSILLGVITVVAGALAVRTWLPDNRWAQIAVPMLMVFWPNQSYMTTHINNDNLSTAVAALVFWLVVDLIRNGVWRLSTPALIGLLVLAALNKGTALFLLPIGLLGLALGLARPLTERARRWVERGLVLLGALVAAAALLALAIPRFAAILWNLALRVPVATRGLTWIVSVLEVFATAQQWQAARLAQNGAETIFILRTFWAVFGWGRYFLPEPWYYAAVLAAVIGMAGWLRLLAQSRRAAMGWAHWQWQVLAVLAVSIPLACVPLAARMIFEPFTTFWHGRSLLPILIPVTSGLALGWWQWLPERWRGRTLQWLAAILLLVDATALAAVILPRFYQ